MNKANLLGPWVRRFLLEHLVTERNLAHNTQESYRDALRLLLPLLARRARRAVDRLTVDDVTPDRLRLHFRRIPFIAEFITPRGLRGALDGHVFLPCSWSRADRREIHFAAFPVRFCVVCRRARGVVEDYPKVDRSGRQVAWATRPSSRVPPLCRANRRGSSSRCSTTDCEPVVDLLPRPL